jgi:PKD repeat protein
MTLNNPSNTFSNAGFYDIKLLVEDIYGCKHDTLKQTFVYYTPKADFTNLNACDNQLHQLIDSSSVDSSYVHSWEWTIINKPPPNTSSDQNPFFIFTDTNNLGLVRLKVVSAQGCIDSIEKFVSVKPLPQADFDFNPKIGLPPLLVDFEDLSSGATNWYWNFGDGSLDTGKTVQHQYVDSAIFDLKYLHNH